jgi:hypothetical protein
MSTMITVSAIEAAIAERKEVQDRLIAQKPELALRAQRGEGDAVERLAALESALAAIDHELSNLAAALIGAYTEERAQAADTARTRAEAEARQREARALEYGRRARRVDDAFDQFEQAFDALLAWSAQSPSSGEDVMRMIATRLHRRPGCFLLAPLTNGQTRLTPREENDHDA